MKAFTAVLAVLFISSQVVGQIAPSNPNEYEEHKPILYRNQVKYGITVHSAGFGIDVRRGFHVTGTKSRVLEAEFLTMRNIKEVKTINPYYESAKAYVYGKLNSLMALRLGAGEQRTLYGKSDRGGIEIQFNYSAGLSLGLAKPNYIDVITDPKNNPFNVRSVKYDTSYAIDLIIGRGPLFKGIDEIKPYPGIFTKVGFAFDWNGKDDRISQLEAGLMVDGYLKPVPIMAFIKNNQVFVNFYITFLFGKKWYTN